jgi:hypothetical protein
MKNLIKVLGLSAIIGLTGLSMSGQEKAFSFLKQENQKYYKSHSFVDINDDSIPEIILAKYDMNQNGIIDTYALFKIIGKDSTNYHSPGYASAVAVDTDEDGIEDIYYLDTDLDGILDQKGKYKKDTIIV